MTNTTLSQQGSLHSARARTRGRFRVMARRFSRSPHALVGGSLVLFLAFIFVFGPTIALDDPYAMSIPDQFQRPSLQHPFGTDEFGRDVFSRVMHAARYSLLVGILATSVAVSGGVVIGLTSGYAARRVDIAIQMMIDVMMAFPGILLAIAIIAILGPGFVNLLLALGIGGIPYYARLVRGQVLSVREREYVEAARMIGVRDWKILAKHIFPNTVSPLIVVASLDLGSVIIFASGLSFVGLCAQPPTPEWGAMLSTGRDFMHQAWWIATFPGLAIVVAVLGFNLLGDGLRDVLDPRGLE
jgi:peptide/nickel transport system permease protein